MIRKLKAYIKAVPKLVFCLIGGLPMAYLMSISDAPLKEGETYASRKKYFWKNIPQVIKKLFDKIVEEELNK